MASSALSAFRRSLRGGWPTVLVLVTACAAERGAVAAADGDLDAAVYAAGGPDAAPAQDALLGTDGGESAEVAATPDVAQGVDAAQEASATAPVAFGLYGLKVSAVAANPLACRVQWDTPHPADSAVSYGIDGFTLRARDPALRLHHDVLVYGLHAEMTYRLLPRSTTASGETASAPEQKFTAGSLPKGIQGAIIDVEAEPAQPLSWVLTSAHLGLPAVGSSLGFPAAAIAYDPEGYPVWFMQWPMSNNASVRWYGDGRMAVMCEELMGVFGVDGTAAWQVFSPFEVGGGALSAPVDGKPHHDLLLLSGGRMARLEFEESNGLLGDRIVELDAQQNPLWSWSTLKGLPPAETWIGTNALFIDASETKALISARNLSTVFLIDRKTGGVIWSAGPTGSLKLTPAPGASWFALQHDAKLLPSGNLMLYDNGMPQRGYSRAVEYQIDAEAGTATQVWQAKGPQDDGWYSAGEGSAQRLADGGTLIAAPDYQKGFQQPTRVMIVDAAGDITWQMRMTPFAGHHPLVYRAEQMTPPGLEVLPPGESP